MSNSTTTNLDANETYAGFGIYILGAHEIRDVVRIPTAAREWDGHTCHLGLRSRHGGYAPVSVTLTGRKVRRVLAVRFDWRVTCKLVFADGSYANAELVFTRPVELDEARAVLAAD